MKFIELFAGIGGFRHGLERAGNFECVYANEWDKYAASIYEKNFGERPDTRSITDVDVSDIPDHELLVGGFPCQAFSIAGKRKGFDDTRGTLFFEIARILQAKRPRYCLLENVKGLLSHDGGRTFQIILQTLDELGYDLQWQVLNSKNFGVPQNRERVFIVGHIRGKRRPEVFPIRENEPIPDGQNGAGQGRTQAEVSATVRGGNMKADHTFIISRDGKPKNKDIAPTLAVGGHGSGNHSDMDLILLGCDGSNSQANRIYGSAGISATLQGLAGGKGAKTGLYMMNTLTEATGNRAGSSKEFIKSVENINKATGQIRRLTPIECERLQGFPDNWTEGISDTQRYKCLGNAVTTNVITAIGERLI